MIFNNFCKFGGSIVLAIYICGCMHTVKIQDFRETANNQTQTTECDIKVVKGMDAPPQNYILLGRVELDDSGFSFWCSEADAHVTFIEQACSLGANIVNIVYERLPGLQSSCYRATAEFIKE